MSVQWSPPMENWECPADIPFAGSWVCTACGRGRGQLAGDEAPEETAGN